MKQITQRTSPNMTPNEDKPGKHAKMTKQSQVIVERQRITVFAYPNLSHFKPILSHFRAQKGSKKGKKWLYWAYQL